MRKELVVRFLAQNKPTQNKLTYYLSLDMMAGKKISGMILERVLKKVIKNQVKLRKTYIINRKSFLDRFG